MKKQLILGLAVAAGLATGFGLDPAQAQKKSLVIGMGSADAGKLDVGTLYTDMIVGIVSRGVVDNGYGHDAVAFWPFPVFPTP